MTARVSNEVEVVPAEESQREILGNLMQLYLHDFSEFDSRDVDESGRYGYRYLDFYWSDPRRWPFLFRLAGQFAGFALVREEAGRFQMAEFFVLRKYRRLGVGEAAARQLFRRFPGLWQVSQLAANTVATAFWREVIGRIAGSFEEVTGEEGPEQLFTSPVRKPLSTGRGGR